MNGIPKEPPATSDNDQFATIDVVADRFGLSPRTIRRAIQRKELVVHRFGRSVRIADRDLRDFIERKRGI